MTRRLVLLVAGVLIASAGYAQAPVPPDKVTVLKAAHLFDGVSGRLSEPGLVVVRGRHIVAVGADANDERDRNWYRITFDRLRELDEQVARACTKS